MFPTQSLLQSIDCPDHLQSVCERVSCPFGHSSQLPKKNSEHPYFSSQSSSKRRASQLEEGERNSSGEEDRNEKVARIKHPSSNNKTSTIQTNKRLSPEDEIGSTSSSHSPSQSRTTLLHTSNKSITQRNAYDASARAATIKVDKQNGKNSSVHLDGFQSPSTSTSSRNHSTGLLTAPLIARNKHPVQSKVSFSDRQGCLRSYFTSFTSLYAPLLPPIPRHEQTKQQHTYTVLKRLAHQLASEHALESEAKVFKMSNINPMTYRNSVRTDLVGVSRRTKEDKQAQLEGKDCLGTLGIEAQKMVEESNSMEVDESVEKAVTELFRSSGFVGTNEDVKSKMKRIQERKESMMTREGLEKAGLMADYKALRGWDYPLPQIQEVDSETIHTKDLQKEILDDWGLGGTQIDRMGENVECTRCGVGFVVQIVEPQSEESQVCCYHWGKRRFVREGNSMRGPRVPRWTCCDALDEETAFSSTSLTQIAQQAGLVAGAGETSTPNKSGCVRGPHVFKEEETKMLHRREAFVSTDILLHQCKQLKNEKASITHDILAFDCELIYTTAGMSLARLTVLDENGEVVLDRFVRPKSAILDYNTRFSGILPKDIPEEDLVDQSHSLESARHALGKLMKAETIFIGHGLENDLRAIRLVHTRVVDSVLLYPHRKGMPFRMSLKELAMVHLRRQIQKGDEQSGHDAEEDARAALELVRLKYREWVNGKVRGGLPGNSSTSVKQEIKKVPSEHSPGTNSQDQVNPVNPSKPFAKPKTDTTTLSTASLFLPRAKRR